MAGSLSKRFAYHFRVWWIMSKNSFSMVISQKIALWFFLTGKVMRFVFFLAFLLFLLKGTEALAGYSTNQTIFFFLTFNLVDVISQFLYREAYRFRPKIISGDFDLALVKPINSLFSALMGGADVMDLFTLPPLLVATYYVGSLLLPTPFQIALYILLVINAIIIATAFYIMILALGIITFEVDNLIMVYRDLTATGRFPVDIYKEPLKGILTFIVPVGIMMTLPGQVLMGLVGAKMVIISFLLSFVLFLLSLKLWNKALLKYTSASS